MAVFDAATIVAKKRRLKLASERKQIQATLETCKQTQANPSDA